VADRRDSDRKIRLLVGGVIAASTLLLMVATEPRLAIAWDEGYTLGRVARARTWINAWSNPHKFAETWVPPTKSEMVQPDAKSAPRLLPPRPEDVDSRTKLLRPSVVAWFWPFAREEPHGHPAFYGIVALLGDAIIPGWAPLPRARLGTMIAFSLTAAAIYLFLAHRWGPWAGALAAGAWVLQPHLFALGHYATYDALLSSLWVGSILAFARAVEGETSRPRWHWVLAFGALAGAAASTKLTGWFLPLPFLAWTLLYRDRRAAITLIGGGMVGLLTIYVLNPPFWTTPIEGVSRFVQSNLSREQTIRIPVLFLGRVVKSPSQSLPWYNTLLWTVLVTPVGFLSLAAFRVLRGLRSVAPEPFGVLVLIHWAFLLALRALPHTPGHDAVRQFLPAFGCLAIVAGLGAATAVERFGRWGKIWIAASLVEGAIGLVLIMPVPLSYFSPIVGGLPGATRLGMEPSFYWDAFGDDALDWLNRHTSPGRKVQFCSFPLTLHYLQQTGRLRAPILLPEETDSAEWYVLQNRPGLFHEWDRALRERGQPSYVVRKFGVPLLLIYPDSEFDRLRISRPQDAEPDARPALASDRNSKHQRLGRSGTRQ
jgi:4-amino-4-deoxy-L-arabinose transferase-like glycosyltransferase